jgi:hypothetical protein
MSCEKTHREDCEITDQTTLELPHDLFSNRSQESKTEEVPELLHFRPEQKAPPQLPLRLFQHHERTEIRTQLEADQPAEEHPERG